MYRFIVNPIAGRGRTPERLDLLVKQFHLMGLAYSVYHTTAPMDGFAKAKEICQTQPNCPGIIGLGGDGTLQEIADGMRSAFPNEKIPVPMGIFPAGSGNDFVMSLMGGKKQALARYKQKNLPEAARLFAQAVRDNRTRAIDLLTANDMAFMNIGNIGLDARIVRNALALKERWGRYAYVAAVYKSIVRHTNVPLLIEVDGEVIDDAFTLVAICNGQYYGGGLHITPDAQIDNGKIKLCLVRGMTRPKTMLIFPSLMMVQHMRLKAVSFIECEELKITLNEKNSRKTRIPENVLCLDGNLYPQNPGQTFHFKVHQKVLDIFV